MIAVGQDVPPLTVSVDRPRLIAYAAASRDHNRIHWDDAFAESVGLPGVIAHGMLVMGAAAECVAAWLGDPTRIVTYTTKFPALLPVPLEGTVSVEVSGTVASVDDEAGTARVDLTVIHDGKRLLGRPQITVRR